MKRKIPFLWSKEYTMVFRSTSNKIFSQMREEGFDIIEHAEKIKHERFKRDNR